jgi:hypothetical protein
VIKTLLTDTAFQPPISHIRMRIAPVFLILATAGLFVLHQDIWFWREARPLVFGFLPVGLAYHGAFCLAATLLMWALTRFAWPSQLEDREER